MFFKKRDSKTWDAVSRASLMGTNMVASTVVGLVIGYYLDKWLGTSPWMLLAWLLFGIVAGFRSMYLETMRINRAQGDAGPDASPAGKNPDGATKNGEPAGNPPSAKAESGGAPRGSSKP